MSGVQGEAAVEQTDVGSYFVANYPPFSAWNAGVGRPRGPEQALDAGRRRRTPLGLYLHIPFCRKRCHFCYFRVYTDKNAREVEQYLDLLAREWELYAKTPAVDGRRFNFVYFGGGTPSFLSTKQLQTVGRLNATARGTTPRRSPSSASPARSPTPSSPRSATWASRGSASASRTSTIASSS